MSAIGHKLTAAELAGAILAVHVEDGSQVPAGVVLLAGQVLAEGSMSLREEHRMLMALADAEARVLGARWDARITW